MENFNQIEIDILEKIKKISDRSSYETIKTEIFGKKGIITELFKKIGSLDQNQRKEYTLGFAVNALLHFIVNRDNINRTATIRWPCFALRNGLPSAKC